MTIILVLGLGLAQALPPDLRQPVAKVANLRYATTAGGDITGTVKVTKARASDDAVVYI